MKKINVDDIKKKFSPRDNRGLPNKKRIMLIAVILGAVGVLGFALKDLPTKNKEGVQKKEINKRGSDVFATPLLSQEKDLDEVILELPETQEVYRIKEIPPPPVAIPVTPPPRAYVSPPPIPINSSAANSALRVSFDDGKDSSLLSSVSNSFGLPQSASNPLNTLGDLNSASLIPNSYRDLNNQADKINFSEEGQQDGAIQARELSRINNRVVEGTLIPAVLITKINTDLPSMVTASVREDVFSSISGKYVLIPQGTRAIGYLNSNVSFGQTRVQIAWQRLILPNGVDLALGNFQAVDKKGAGGVTGIVDSKLYNIFGIIALETAFSVLTAGINNLVITSDDVTRQLTEDTTANTLSATDELLRRAMDIQPTIHVASGERFNIIVSTDLLLPIYAKEK